jgi:hypothetical protein
MSPRIWAFVILFWSTAGAWDTRCRSAGFYESMEKKPLTYWVYSPGLRRCILVFSGNGGLKNGGEGIAGNSGSGGEGHGKNGKSKGGSGKGAGQAPQVAEESKSESPTKSWNPYQSAPQPTEPPRQVASDPGQMEIIFETKKTNLPNPTRPSPSPSPSPAQSKEPPPEKAKAPDLT